MTTDDESNAASAASLSADTLSSTVLNQGSALKGEYTSKNTCRETAKQSFQACQRSRSLGSDGSHLAVEKAPGTLPATAASDRSHVAPNEAGADVVLPRPLARETTPQAAAPTVHKMLPAPPAAAALETPLAPSQMRPYLLKVPGAKPPPTRVDLQNAIPLAGHSKAATHAPHGWLPSGKPAPPPLPSGKTSTIKAAPAVPLQFLQQGHVMPAGGFCMDLEQDLPQDQAAQGSRAFGSDDSRLAVEKAPPKLPATAASDRSHVAANEAGADVAFLPEPAQETVPI